MNNELIDQDEQIRYINYEQLSKELQSYYDKEMFYDICKKCDSFEDKDWYVCYEHAKKLISVEDDKLYFISNYKNPRIIKVICNPLILSMGKFIRLSDFK